MSDLVERAKAVLEGITAGPWEHATAPHPDERATHAEWLAGTLIGEGEALHVLTAASDEPRFAYVVPAVTGDGPTSARNAEFIAAARTLVPELVAEVERQRREQDGFSGRLGFGDNISEPAASLADMVDPIEAAFADGRDHQECPRLCEGCGDSLATERCSHCHGSGGNAAVCEASGAYAECEWCAGSGWVHEGCVEVSYADLAAEVARLRPYAGPGPFEPSETDGAKAPTWQELRDLADHNFRLYAHAQSEVERLRRAARLVVKSFREVESRGDLYDAATHRCVDLLSAECSPGEERQR